MEIFTTVATVLESVAAETAAVEATKLIINEGVYTNLEKTIATESFINLDPVKLEAVTLNSKEVVLNDETKYKTLDESLKEASAEEIKIYEEANLRESTVNGREALIRTDIDYAAKDQFGRTNLERMEQGLAPLVDGQPIELHHIGQEMDSPLAELTRNEHRGEGNYSVLHDVAKESEINRTLFNLEKEAHWKARAEQIKEAGGI
ncbi:HNH/ENDO VII family nuclease [Cytobacillus sp. S13-E01]|uniref:HNH/ENDO VII family nuclease n=1 Tax=Cytobacillus sp. S13-E01 TaxID=3031326 RepID=UPI0023D87EC5|nr:HNH/ENDO VII family nuclease [Cytobacillus sp. S13-E01]MDF0728885.1 HNH/ENDO VII family nuclease [Cytobacillus sp. S13-E01]